MPSPSPPPLPPRVPQPSARSILIQRSVLLPPRPSQPIPVPVSLPNHPPYSVSPRPSLIRPGSGPVTPVGTPSSSVRHSVISCPLASQQVAASLAQQNIVPEETPASSLDWDNYESSPELLGRKIPIVSTQCSSLEHLE